VDLGLPADEDPSRHAVEGVHVVCLAGCGCLRRGGRHRFEKLANLAGARGPLGRVLLEQPEDQGLQALRDLWVVPRGCDGRGVDVLRDDRHRVVTEKRRPARQHLVEGGAQGVEVAAGVRWAAQGLLRRHVGHRAHHHPLLGEPGTVEGEGQAEVAEARRAVGREPDVAGLQVPVYHAARVGVLEGVAELGGDRERLVDIEPRFEVAAAHVLAHDVGLAVLLAGVVDGDDARVIAEAPHRLGLAAHADAAGLVEALGLDQGQGDVAVEPLVAREVDALLGAFSEQALHLVAAGGKRARGAGLRRWRRSRLGKRRAALAAELEFRWVLESAARAGPRQGGAAVAAELEAARVLVAAGGTAHAPGS